MIVYAWVNDENTLRSSGSKSDPYAVFLKMLERGNPPDTWDLTSQKTDRLFSGEFRIGKSEHPAAYASAGLSYDTKFDLRSVLELPFNDAYFSVPPQAPHGQTPQLGTLHPSMVRIAATAFSAARL